MPEAPPPTPPSTGDLRVVDLPDRSRFELLLDERRVGLADYRLRDGVLVIPHVETDPEHRGNGYAAVLMDGVVAAARSAGRTIRPICPYAAAYLRDRPETHDLVAR